MIRRVIITKKVFDNITFSTTHPSTVAATTRNSFDRDARDAMRYVSHAPEADAHASDALPFTDLTRLKCERPRQTQDHSWFYQSCNSPAESRRGNCPNILLARARFANNLASPQFPWTRLVSRTNRTQSATFCFRPGPIFRLRFPASRKRRLYHRALSRLDGQIALMLHAFELICCLPLGTDRQDGANYDFIERMRH